MMLYWVNTFLLWTLCGGQFSDISQPVSFQTVKLGDAATIECEIQSEMYKRVWYRVTTRRELQLVATFNTKYNRSTFDSKFLHRYSVNFDRVSGHLSISQATWEDTGTYYCGAVYLNDIQFGSGTFLMLKGAYLLSHFVVQEPELWAVNAGEAMTLNCSLHTGHSSAEHFSVMWLKISEVSAPQMVYLPGFKNNTCERTESGNSTCVHSLVMGNLSPDDTGTYLCVVTGPAEILFGSGTRIKVHMSKQVDLSPTVVALILSNIFFGTVALLLLWMQCKSWVKGPTEVSNELSDRATTGDGVIYASVSSAPGNVLSRQTREKNRGDCVVYSDIQYCQRTKNVCFPVTQTKSRQMK